MVVTLGHLAKLKSISLCVCVCVCVQICGVYVTEREMEGEKGDRAVERGWRELQRVRGI